MDGSKTVTQYWRWYPQEFKYLVWYKPQVFPWEELPSLPCADVWWEPSVCASVRGKTSCEHGRRIAPSAAHYRENTSRFKINNNIWLIWGMKQVQGKTSCEHGRRIAPSVVHYRENTLEINIWINIYSFDEKTLEINNNIWLVSIYLWHETSLRENLLRARAENSSISCSLQRKNIH